MRKIDTEAPTLVAPFSSALALPYYRNADGEPIPYDQLDGMQRVTLAGKLVEHREAVARTVDGRLRMLFPKLQGSIEIRREGRP